MSEKDRSSILLSIFRRKGGEGDFTKTINENNRSEVEKLFAPLLEGEKGLIVYLQNDENRFLLTNIRIISIKEKSLTAIPNNSLIRVDPAFHEEFNERITDSNKFTRLRVIYKNNIEYILWVEKGEPFQGIFQVLHFIASSNKHSS